MKKSFIILIIIVLASQISSAQVFNQKRYNHRTGKEILIGYCNRDAFKGGEFGKWFRKEYNYYDYLVDKKALAILKTSMDSIKSCIIMGTWCSDSRVQVPRFYKIMDKIGYPDENITLICVDESKKAPGIDIDQYSIIRIPTFIFYKEGKEIGRIVETPDTSLEEDICKILEFNLNQ
jgi:thiol-disulfide isomerase/thioredoxin